MADEFTPDLSASRTAPAEEEQGRLTRPGPGEGDLGDRLRYYRLRYFTPLLVFLFSLRFVTLVVWLMLLVPTRYDVSFPESAVVMGAWKVMYGGAAYEDWREWPHHFAPYGPLTYYLPGWIGRVFGPGSAPWNLFVIGRTLSLSCLAGLCALLWVMVRRGGGERVFAAVSIAALLTWDELFQFLSSFRPDAPRVFFTMLAFSLMWRRPATPARCIGVWASLWVAFWYKATSWAVPLVAVVWIARERGKGTALAWFGGWAVSGLVPALILNARLDGTLLLNLVTGMDNGFEVKAALLVISKYIPAVAVMHVIALWMSVRELRGSTASGARDLLPVTLVLTLMFTAIQSFKRGADANYLIDLHVFSVVTFTIRLQDVWRERSGMTRTRAESLLFVLLVLPGIFNGVRGLVTIREDTESVLRARRPIPMAAYAGLIEGEILVVLPNFAIIRPAPPTIMDYFHYQVLLERGRLDPEILLDRVRNRRFSAMILATNDLDGSPGFTGKEYMGRDFLPTVRRHYELYGESGRFSVLVPKGTAGRTLPPIPIPGADRPGGPGLDAPQSQEQDRE